MSNALDTFRAQQEAVERVHIRLGEVAGLLAEIHAQIDTIVNDRELREVLREEQNWLESAQRTIVEVRRWREQEERRYWPGIAYRWITALAFALVSALAVGSGYGWVAKPFAAELEALRPKAEFGVLVEHRMTTMSAAERRQFDALMKWRPAPP
jgi:hypothetical protein